MSSCDFHGPYFGAAYPDACCVDRYLWDLDSCDGPGGLLRHGGDVPCHQCNHDEWLESFAEEIRDEGHDAATRGFPRGRPRKAIRWQRRGDQPKMKKWFAEGWDEAHTDGEACCGDPEGGAQL